MRIQARSTDEDESGVIEPASAGAKSQHKHVGAIDILAKVLRTKGIVGWYQVRSVAERFILYDFILC